MHTSQTSVDNRSQKEKTEVSGYVEEPVKLIPAHSTDLETFKFKDLRNQLKTRKKA